MYSDPPPYLQALTDDPDARRFWNGVAPAVSLLQGRPAELAELCLQARKRRIAILGESRLTNPAKEADINASRASALQAIDRLYAEAEDDYQAIAKAIAGAMETVQPADASVGLLQEMKLGRAWQRAVRILDANPDNSDLLRAALGLATSAAEARDTAMLAALHQELRGYLQSRKMGQAADGILARVLDAEAPFLPAKARAAGLLEQDVQRGWARVVAGFASARHDVASDNSSTLLPGFAQNEVFRF